MLKMSEMSFSFSLNAMLSMSKMSKIDQIYLNAIMLCMSKMGKEHTDTFCSTPSLTSLTYIHCFDLLYNISHMH